MSEIWKPVVGWEKLYEVSDGGRIASIRRRTASGWRGGKIIGRYIRHDGYPEVQLCAGADRRHIKRFVHHLVLEAFVGPRPEGQEALHGPGGKLDASIGNLQWGTRKQNTGPDRVRDRQSNRGEHHGLTNLTWAQVCEIRERIAAGEQQKALAVEFGVCKQTITNIKQRKVWAHPPEEW